MVHLKRFSFRKRTVEASGQFPLSSKTNPASPHENGDVEKSNDLFKRAVDQSLILRGNRDFGSVEEYEKFLQKIMDRMNQNCHKRFAEELEVLKELPNLRYDDYEIRTCKVGRGGTFRLLHNTYSAHSRLVGETVKIRLYADKLEIWYAQRHIETLPRLRRNLLKLLLPMNLAMRNIFMSWPRGNARFEGQTRLPDW